MYLFYDTETDGKYNFSLPFSHPSQPNIAQLAAQVTDINGKVKAEMNVLIKPLRPDLEMPEGAFQVHGITMEDLYKYGVPIYRAIDMFTSLVDTIPFEYGGYMVAHNEKFDTGMIRAAMFRAGILWEDGVVPFSLENGFVKFCTMKVATNVLKIKGPRGNKWPTLQEAVKMLCGREQNNAHDAMGDVIDCRDVFFALKKIWEQANGEQATGK